MMIEANTKKTMIKVLSLLTPITPHEGRDKVENNTYSCRNSSHNIWSFSTHWQLLEKKWGLITNILLLLPIR